MTETLIVPLSALRLPADFPSRVRFVSAVEAELRQLRSSGRFLPARFFGYYFRAGRLIGVSGRWTVALDATGAALQLLDAVGEVTHGQYSISTLRLEGEPDYILVHDRHIGECWLWRFTAGLRFVEATDPVDGGDVGWDGATRNLLGY